MLTIAQARDIVAGDLRFAYRGTHATDRRLRDVDEALTVAAWNTTSVPALRLAVQALTHLIVAQSGIDRSNPAYLVLLDIAEDLS